VGIKKRESERESKRLWKEKEQGRQRAGKRERGREREGANERARERASV